MRFIAGIILTLLLTPVFSPAAITVSTEPIPLKYRAEGREAWSRIYVISLIYPKVGYTVKSAELLSKLQKEFAGKSVTVYALIPDSGNAIKEFAEANSNLTFTVKPDPELKTTRRLYQRSAAQGFPECGIFNYAGKLLWSGNPLDLEMMLKKITSGKYSEREEIRISALDSSLQAALRSGDPKIIGQAADQLLTLRPEQLSAVNAKAYSLEIAGDVAGLEKFFRGRIQKFPDEPVNYLMLLEAALRIPELNGQLPLLAEEFIKKFPDDIENINAVAWSLLNNAPFDAAAFAVVCKAGKLLQAHPRAANSSRVLATRALIAYRQCDLDKAITLVKRAIAQAGSIKEKNMLTGLEKYFNQVKVEK